LNGIDLTTLIQKGLTEYAETERDPPRARPGAFHTQRLGRVQREASAFLPAESLHRSGHFRVRGSRPRPVADGRNRKLNK
jgi:hypothetical protein